MSDDPKTVPVVEPDPMPVTPDPMPADPVPVEEPDADHAK